MIQRYGTKSIITTNNQTIGDKINDIVNQLKEFPSTAEFIASAVLTKVVGASQSTVWKDIVTNKLASQLAIENKQ